MDNEQMIIENGKLKIENAGLPKGWEVKKLVDVCIVERGSSPRPIKEFLTNDENGVNWIKIGDTKNVDKYIYSTNQKITKKGAEKSRFVEEGDFILSNSMSFGKPYIMKTKGYIHDGWFKLKLHDFIDTEYFYQLLSSPYVNEQFHNLASGAVVKNISGDLVKKVVLPIPPLPEQKRIVSMLDRAFEAIDKAKANAEQNLKNAKELFESYLQGVFSNGKLKIENGEWEEKMLEQISDVFGRGKSRHRPRNDKKLYGGKYPFIQTGDIRNCNHYITDYSQTYNEIGLAQSKLWPKGTICITIAANIAETGILSFDACFPDSVIGIVVNKKIADLDFVEYLLQSFRVKIQSLGKGSAQDNINMGTFKNKLFPFPLVKEQKQIVKKLDALSAETKKLEAIYQQKIDDLEELKKSILQKAFMGELTMSVP